MYYFAEHSLLYHVERGKFKIVVAAVFEHDAVAAVFFGCIDQSPAVGDAHGCRNFHCNVLTALHGVECNFGMAHPVGADVDEVHLFRLAQ